MDWWIALVLFAAVQVAGIAIAISWLRSKSGPFPVYGRPNDVFWLVRREDRAAYARIMHRTMAVQMRDMGRAFTKFQRELGQRVLPVMQRFADAVAEAFGK